ncbi:exosortase C-terminal domain/associated protein EpsI [Desulfonatronovibrio hydrogenovorans]|uniref:exosortase C-terminal domain/associated protein EpsI n=1 Tax=Desulfonatronovibrio hydrogenovorans TaxID=53245 RepID=UPI00068E46ED|nr:exosortase C-terminal domain/associated protein EpsI [Desulfonatronovibrio hydrogenovorans]
MTSKTDKHQFNRTHILKVAVLCLVLVGAAGFVHSFDSETETAIKVPLKYFPYEFGTWEARNNMELLDSVAAVLGVDDYAFRDYRSPYGTTINFYASYFAANNRNKGFHSPLNCMPGAGWNISSTDEVDLVLPDGSTVRVRKMLLKRGSHYQVSLYWYQCRSRIIASEYWERFYRVLDSIRYGRTDGAFIRLIVTGSDEEGEALDELKSFAALVIPQLEEHFPGL